MQSYSIRKLMNFLTTKKISFVIIITLIILIEKSEIREGKREGNSFHFVPQVFYK